MIKFSKEKVLLLHQIITEATGGRAESTARVSKSENEDHSAPATRGT